MRATKTSAAGAARPAGLAALDIRLPRIQAAIAAIFFLSQIAWITRDLSGLSTSESQMGAIGLRTLDGFGLADHFLESMAGSHLWPVIAAAGYQLGGEIGARLIALLLTSIALLALYGATRSLFGDRAAVWTLAVFAVSAPFTITGQMALMEPLAIAALSGGLWAAARLASEDHRRWVAVIAALMLVATFAQYRAGLALLPISLVIAVLRGRRSRIDLVVLWSIVALGLIVYFDAFTDQLAKLSMGALLFDPYEGAAAFASTQTKMLLILLWGALPLAAGGLAWWRLRAQRRLIAALLCGPLLWIVALLAFANFDHSLVYPDISLGLLFVLPVVGLFLASLPQTRWNLTGNVTVLGVLALAGAVQTSTLAQSWIDFRPINDVLAEEVQPGDLVMANDPWPVRIALYEGGNIEAVSDVIDEETLLGSDVIYDFCEFKWIVSESLIQPWSAFVQPSVASCGEIETMYSARVVLRSLDAVMLPQSSTGTIEASRNSTPIEIS